LVETVISKMAGVHQVVRIKPEE